MPLRSQRVPDVLPHLHRHLPHLQQPQGLQDRKLLPHNRAELHQRLRGRYRHRLHDAGGYDGRGGYSETQVI